MHNASSPEERVENAAVPRYEWPTHTERRPLFVVLNHNELAAFSRKLAETVPQIANLQRDAKASASQWKARIETVEVEQSRLSGIVSEGREERPVECVWIYECSGIDTASGERIHHPEKKALFRQDTMEVLEIRDITSDERQMSLLPEEEQQEEEQQEEEQQEEDHEGEEQLELHEQEGGDGDGFSSSGEAFTEEAPVPDPRSLTEAPPAEEHPAEGTKKRSPRQPRQA